MSESVIKIVKKETGYRTKTFYYGGFNNEC